MNSKENNDLEKVLTKVIEKVIAPRIKKLEEKTAIIMEAVADTKEDMTILKDEFVDMGYTVERIETKLDASIRRQDSISIKTDQLNRRVLKLETRKH